MAVEVLVEVGVAVDGLPPMISRVTRCGPSWIVGNRDDDRGRLVSARVNRGGHRGNAGGDPRSLMQEISAAGGRSAGISGSELMNRPLETLSWLGGRREWAQHTRARQRKNQHTRSGVENRRLFLG